MKRIGYSLLILAPLALASCGGDSAVGVYSFQMGKPSGAHIMTSITLRDNEVTRSDKTFGKSMTFFLQAVLGDHASSSEDSQQSESSTEESFSKVISEESIESAIESSVVSFADSSASSSSSAPKSLQDSLYDLLAEGITIEGYYTVENLPQKGITQLHIGFFLDEIEEITGETFNLEPDVIEKIVYSEISEKSITLKIPVSIQDVIYQLYWYGFDILEFTELPLEDQHEANTHPTKEDIDRINQTYPDNHGGNKFRDYYTISLGLTKE